VKSEEIITIPIPSSEDGVESMLSALRSDESVVIEADVDELEEAINDVVYEMLNITPEEQNAIEEYLDTFRVY